MHREILARDHKGSGSLGVPERQQRDSRSLCATERHISTRARNVLITAADRARRALTDGRVVVMARRAATHTFSTAAAYAAILSLRRAS